MLAVIVSTTIASVIELFGKFKAPLTFKLVEVTLVPLALPKLKRPETLALVPVALVKVRAPILVTPETYRLVVVAPIPTIDRPPIMVVETPLPPI